MAQIIMAGVEDHDGQILSRLRRENPVLRQLPFKLVGWMQEAIDAHSEAHCPGHDAEHWAFGKCIMCDPNTEWEDIPGV